MKNNLECDCLKKNSKICEDLYMSIHDTNIQREFAYYRGNSVNCLLVELQKCINATEILQHVNC